MCIAQYNGEAIALQSAQTERLGDVSAREAETDRDRKEDRKEDRKKRRERRENKIHSNQPALKTAGTLPEPC